MRYVETLLANLTDLTPIQEVKATAAVAVKELGTREKEQVNLVERKKHATTKVKKLKKSIQEDQKDRDEADRFVESNIEKMAKEKKKLEGLEESLSQEEKIMEEIRDSLKGMISWTEKSD